MSQNIALEKPQLVYVFDPMCGWCYAFGDVMQQFYNRHKDEYQFDVVTGGMIVGESQKPLSHMRDYIKGAIPRLVEMTGAQFGSKYLNEILEQGTYISSSEKPSFAFVAFKRMQPQKTIEFAHDLQKTFFYEGNSLNEDKTYKILADQYGIEGNMLIDSLNSNTIKEAAFKEFELAKQWGIKGYPAVVIFYKNKGYMIANGYSSLDNLEKNVDTFMKEHSKD